MNPAVVCDLDGVVYLGSEPVPGAGEALSRMEAAGHEILFCTNNSVRTRQATADKIRRLSGYPARPEQVLSSATAGAALAASSPGPALVVGGPGIFEALEEVGIDVTDDPDQARVVVVGLDREITYQRLADASRAVRAGARLVATNHDATFPTPDGQLPGAGSIVAAVETASGVAAEVAGKPHPAMRELIRRRVADRPVWLVGDRPDTDLQMAVAEGWRAVLVLTGVAGSADGVEPPPEVVAASLADVPEAIAARVRT